ncbi:MAG: Sapep family Mn(2+)-dependent dipeptidase [Clostridia bacterium]|nr:Sapep family Mn(2+)-dependent dipeptidase [Clostridia bacterium]
MNKIVDSIIERDREKLIASLRESIRIPSTEAPALPGMPFGKNVSDALHHALETAKSLGLKTTDMDGYVGCVELGEGEEMVGVICHLDVVPEGTGWKHPPYEAVIEDGVMYGRGVLDDKGPAFASIYALAAIREAGIPLRRRIRVILGTNEETGWGCMDYYREHGEAPTLGFTPDGEYPVVNSEKGILHTTFEKRFESRVRMKAGTRPNVVPGRLEAFIPCAPERLRAAVDRAALSDFKFETEEAEGGSSFTVIGLDAHASMPEAGFNSIQAAFTVLDLLGLEGADGEMIANMHRALGMGLHGESMGLDVMDASGRLTLNPGVLEWNENGIVDFKIDVRHPISLSAEEVKKAETEALGMPITHEHAQHGLFVPAESELVSKLLDVYAARTGERPAPLAIGGGTYARAFDNVVAFGCEIPGHPSPVHMPNELISLDDLMFDAHMIADAMLALAE